MGLADAVFRGERRLRGPSLPPLADLGDLRVGELRIGVLFARRLPASPSTLAVFGVVLRAANPQMSRIDAGRIVASVEYLATRWDGANQPLIGEAVSANRAARRGDKDENAVSEVVAGSNPLPAVVIVTLLNFRPEAGNRVRPMAFVPRTIPHSSNSIYPRTLTVVSAEAKVTRRPIPPPTREVSSRARGSWMRFDVCGWISHSRIGNSTVGSEV